MSAIERVEPAASSVASAAPVTPQAMLATAVSRGDMALAEKLMDLADRWEARSARKAFDTAIAAAKAELPVIVKNREMNAGAGRTTYRYEDMASIARAVDPVLSKHGLGYRFRTSGTATHLTVTCILFHQDGHSEENSLTGPNDTSGSKNAIQSIGSAQTYLQRYTLKAALGIAASVDDDAAAVEDRVPDRLTARQVADISDLLKAKNAPLDRFCKWARVERIQDIPAFRYQACVDAINNYKGAQS